MWTTKNKSLLLLAFLIIILGAFVRYYRFVDLMNFSYGQGNALNLSGEMIAKQRPALISQLYKIRETPSGHSFFHSGAYLYPLAPLQLLFDYDPVPITAVFALINIASAVGLFFVIKKFFNHNVALFALTLFLFSPAMVAYSRFIWHVNLLIPIITLSIYYFLTSRQKSRNYHYLVLGICSGLGFGIHIGFAIPGIFLFFWTVSKSLKYKNLSLVPLFFLGLLIGNLPIVIFDLRNHFYNTLTMLEFLTSLGQGTQKGGFTFENYHFISLLVPAFLVGGIVLDKLKKINIFIPVFILIAYLGYSAPLWNLNSPYPIEMASGWNYSGLKKAAAIIATDNPPAKYEIASIIDGETRSTNMRYLLTYLYRQPPMGVADYPQAEVLYVIARQDQDPVNYKVWEINTIKPVEVSATWPLQNDIYLYKLIPVK